MINERIKELIKQAGLDDDMFPIDEWDNPELEKFAELIVIECALIARKMEIHKQPYIGISILEHFGVEE